MGIFGGQKPHKMFGVRVNQSRYGYPVPVVMGTAQVQQSVLWVDGFKSGKVKPSTGGKGIGAKASEYDYTADVVAALCCGPVVGIGDTWSGQSWFGNPSAAETYTVASPYAYTPTYAATFLQDLGAYLLESFSGSYNDLGAPEATVLSGTYAVPMIQDPYTGSNPTVSGHYQVNPSTGEYLFASADNGKQINIPYSYTVRTTNQQQRDIVPAGLAIIVAAVGSPGAVVHTDYGVVYGPDSPNAGKAFTSVSGSPSAAGTYSARGFGNSTVTYYFASADLNEEVVISYSSTDPNAVADGEATQLTFTLATGAVGQTPFAFLSASFPGAAFGYSGVATVLYQPMDLGMGANVQQNRFEVITADRFGAGIIDCNPVQCIGRVLTDPTWGLGTGPVTFPAQCIDNGSSGTWGAASATAGVGTSNSTAFNWFAAQGFFISPVIDSQNSAASLMGKWLEAGCCAAFFSEGLLKLVPYGDTSAAANGCTWQAPSAYAVALDDTCFLDRPGEDPVKITRTAAHDAWNWVQIEWNNRANQYAPEILQESDQAFIARWGERRESPQQYDFIHTQQPAAFAANMRLKRGLYIRNSYEFALPFTCSYLEPMDIVTITTSSVWAQGTNNTNLGISGLPVRIRKIVDDPEKGLSITAEDYPWGAHQPTIYNKQIGAAGASADAFADPGNSEVVVFAETTGRLTGYASNNEAWVGALGASGAWGGCNVWASSDGTTYKQIGTISSPGRIGALASSFPSHADPDTADSLVINLAANCPAWDAGSSADADKGNTLVFVDGEVVAYSALTYTSQNQITCGTYIRRGQMGTAIAAHSAGGLVMRLDDAVFRYSYDPGWLGGTLYLKFQSFNSFGNCTQELSSLTAVTLTLPSSGTGTVDGETGLVGIGNVKDSATLVRMPSPPSFSGAASQSLTNSGSATVIDVSAGTYWLGGTTITANSGSVDPGHYGGPFFVYFTLPSIATQTLSPTYQYTTNHALIAQSPYNVYAGQITAGLLDAVAADTPSASATILTAPITLPSSTDLLLMFCAADNTASTVTMPAVDGWSNIAGGSMPFWNMAYVAAPSSQAMANDYAQLGTASSGVFLATAFRIPSSGSAFESWNYGQNTSSAVSSLATASYAVASGALQVAFVRWTGSATISSISDAAGSVWSLIGTWAEGTSNLAAYFAQNCPADASNVLTVHWSTTVTDSVVAALAWSGAGTGGGSSAGTSGYDKSAYPPPYNWCFSGDTEVLTPDGPVRFDRFRDGSEVVTLEGPRRARLVRHDATGDAPLCEIPGGGLVSAAHVIRRPDTGWSAAGSALPPSGERRQRLYNLHIEDGNDFVLACGLIAHDMKGE